MEISNMDQRAVVARTLWGEARDQGLDGMAAVASVIMTRAGIGGWWGDTPREVCLQPWQFSCWNKGNPNREKLLNVTASDPYYKDALMIAYDALSDMLRDRTSGATNYYAPKIVAAPQWAYGLEPTARIGDHLFFKLGG